MKQVIFGIVMLISGFAFAISNNPDVVQASRNSNNVAAVVVAKKSSDQLIEVALRRISDLGEDYQNYLKLARSTSYNAIPDAPDFVSQKVKYQDQMRSITVQVEQEKIKIVQQIAVELGSPNIVVEKMSSNSEVFFNELSGLYDRIRFLQDDISHSEANLRFSAFTEKSREVWRSQISDLRKQIGAVKQNLVNEALVNSRGEI